MKPTITTAGGHGFTTGDTVTISPPRPRWWVRLWRFIARYTPPPTKYYVHVVSDDTFEICLSADRAEFIAFTHGPGDLHRLGKIYQWREGYPRFIITEIKETTPTAPVTGGCRRCWEIWGKRIIKP